MSLFRGLIRHRVREGRIEGFRTWDDSCVWSGVYRGATNVPTLLVIIKLRSWSLPLSVSFMSHLITKPGVTIGIGPVYFSWGRV